MNDKEVSQEDFQYSDKVKNAVRYGYEYRKEAERQEDTHLHACLPNPSGGGFYGLEN